MQKIIKSTNHSSNNLVIHNMPYGTNNCVGINGKIVVDFHTTMMEVSGMECLMQWNAINNLELILIAIS